MSFVENGLDPAAGRLKRQRIAACQQLRLLTDDHYYLPAKLPTIPIPLRAYLPPAGLDGQLSCGYVLGFGPIPIRAAPFIAAI